MPGLCITNLHQKSPIASRALLLEIALDRGRRQIGTLQVASEPAQPGVVRCGRRPYFPQWDPPRSEPVYCGKCEPRRPETRKFYLAAMISRNLYKASRQLGWGLLDERENRLRKLALTVHFRTVAPSAP